MATLSPSPKLQIIDSSGAPIVGALLYTYLGGTDTPKDTYTDYTGDVANTNPVVSDASGYIEVWLGTGAYKFLLTDGVGATLFDPDTPEGTTIYTVDNINGSSAGGSIQIVDSIAELRALDEGGIDDIVVVKRYRSQGDGGGGTFYWNDTSSSSDDNGIIITPTSTTGNGRWIRLIETEINPRWYGAYGDGTHNDTAAFTSTNTFCTGGTYTIVVDAGTYLFSTDPSMTKPIKLLPKAKLKWSTAINPALDVIIDPNDNTQHFDDGGNSPVFVEGLTVKPQWWGAVGNGSTDDTAAMTYAAKAVPVGGTLYIPGVAESYIVGNVSDYVITLKSYMNIKGDGDSSTLKVKASTNSAYAVIGHNVASQLTDVNIDGIAINGNQANNASSGIGILINAYIGHIRNCVIYDLNNCGINTYSIYYKIENNYLQNCTSFITVSQANNTTIKGNILYANVSTSLATYGIAVVPTANKVIIDTDIVNNTLIGVPITAIAVPATPTTITSLNVNDNMVDLSRTGLGGNTALSCITVLEAIGNIQIARNILYSQSAQTGGGIYCGSATTQRALQMDISGNTIRMADANIGNLHNGINISWSSGCVVKDNNIRCAAASTDYGIKEIGTCTDVFYEANVIINFTNDTHLSGGQVTSGSVDINCSVTNCFTVLKTSRLYWEKTERINPLTPASVKLFIKGVSGISNSEYFIMLDSSNGVYPIPASIRPNELIAGTIDYIDIPCTVIQSKTASPILGGIDVVTTEPQLGAVRIYSDGKLHIVVAKINVEAEGIYNITPKSAYFGDYFENDAPVKGIPDTLVEYQIWP